MIEELLFDVVTPRAMSHTNCKIKMLSFLWYFYFQFVLAVLNAYPEQTPLGSEIHFFKKLENQLIFLLKSLVLYLSNTFSGSHVFNHATR